jgi:hypothetical protein
MLRYRDMRNLLGVLLAPEAFISMGIGLAGALLVAIAIV